MIFSLLCIDLCFYAILLMLGRIAVLVFHKLANFMDPQSPFGVRTVGYGVSSNFELLHVVLALFTLL